MVVKINYREEILYNKNAYIYKNSFTNRRRNWIIGVQITNGGNQEIEILNRKRKRKNSI